MIERLYLSDGFFFVKCSLWAGLMTGALWLLAAAPPIGIIATGLVVAHGVELQHQAIHRQRHGTALLNHLVGFVLGAPLLVSFQEYRVNHLHHHRFLGTDRDAEQFEYRTATLGQVLASVLLLANLRGVVRGAFLGETGARFVPRERRVVHVEKIALLLSHAMALGATAATAGWAGLAAYVGVLLIASMTHVAIEIPEHWDCDRTTREPLRNTRTIRTNPLAQWFTNGNNFHAEHHMKAGLTPEQCRRLHLEIRDRLHHVDEGYLAFYARLLRGRSAAVAGVRS